MRSSNGIEPDAAGAEAGVSAPHHAGGGTLSERVERALTGARAAGTHVAFALLELENFDFVHKTLSKRHAERLLCAIMRRLERALPPPNLVTRVGKSTFTLLIPAASSAAAARELKRAHAALTRTVNDGSLTLNLAPRLGAAVATAGNLTADQLMARAAAASAKGAERGEGPIYFYEEHAGVERREAAAALRGEQLTLHYQPRVRLLNGAVESVEALLRWRHPARGLLRAAEFVPQFEETGLSAELFQWVLERAVAQASVWRSARTPRRIAINVSESVIASGSVAAAVEGALSDFDLHPGLLELEISERARPETLRGAVDELTHLRRMGVHVALDDFGSANAPHSLLQSLPLTGLKIDQSFVRPLSGMSEPEEIHRLGVLIELGRRLKLVVTAKGVETPVQKSLLKALECDQGQGYHFSRPIPAEALPASA